MIKSGIYAILNLLNGKRYIGSAVDLEGRRKSHFRALEKGNHHNIHLQRAFEKYGRDAFRWIIIERVGNLESLLPSEQPYLDIYWPTRLLYNSSPTAGSTLGCRWKCSEETCRKNSETSLKQWADPKQRENASRTALKYWEDPKRREKVSEATLKQWEDPEQRKKMVEAALKRWEDPEQRLLSSETTLGLWADPEYRQMMLATNPALRKGYQQSDETKQKEREVALKHWSTEEYIQKQRDTSPILWKSGEQNLFFGKHHSAEAKRKNSEAHKRENLSVETRRKNSEAHKGERNYNYGDHRTFVEKFGPERAAKMKQNLSEARKRWWARKRAEDSGGLDE